MQVRFTVGGVYRGAYYRAGELANMPDEVARQLVERQLAAATVQPPLRKTPIAPAWRNPIDRTPKGGA